MGHPLFTFLCVNYVNFGENCGVVVFNNGSIFCRHGFTYKWRLIGRKSLLRSKSINYFISYDKYFLRYSYKLVIFFALYFAIRRKTVIGLLLILWSFFMYSRFYCTPARQCCCCNENVRLFGLRLRLVALYICLEISARASAKLFSTNRNSRTLEVCRSSALYFMNVFVFLLCSNIVNHC